MYELDARELSDQELEATMAYGGFSGFGSSIGSPNITVQPQINTNVSTSTQVNAAAAVQTVLFDKGPSPIELGVYQYNGNSTWQTIAPKNIP